jgi:hypothetical protein
MIVGFLLGYHSAPCTKAPASSEPRSTASLLPASISRSGDSASLTTKQTQNIVEKWQAIQDQSLTPESEERMRAMLQSLGASDPVTALQLAQKAQTPRQREILRNAVLQGWASRDPHAAATWTLANVRSEERRAAVEMLAAGSIAQPEAAIRTFQYLIASDPLLASDHGNALVTAFAHSGNYETASQFAATGPAEFRAAWLCTVYNQWATYQPQNALAALGKITDSAASQEARAGLFAGWGSSDPAGLVAYAQALPSGEARLQALNEGLSQWVNRDPVAASAWMDKFDPSPDLDAGAAAVAVAPALIAKKPDVAASWAESITNPELRASTLLDLIRLWAEHDSAAARRYAATSPAIAPETRELALANLQSSP